MTAQTQEANQVPCGNRQSHLGGGQQLRYLLKCNHHVNEDQDKLVPNEVKDHTRVHKEVRVDKVSKDPLRVARGLVGGTVK